MTSCSLLEQLQERINKEAWANSRSVFALETGKRLGALLPCFDV